MTTRQQSMDIVEWRRDEAWRTAEEVARIGARVRRGDVRIDSAIAVAQDSKSIGSVAHGRTWAPTRGGRG